MPLIIITGIPCSGKSTRSVEIKNYFETTKQKTVHIVSENEAIKKAGFEKNELYLDSHKEKLIRGALKSDTLRLLSRDNVVILDAGNYIKGYRYELFCASKAARTSQCTIYCAIPSDNALEFNKISDEGETYTKEVFDALCLRYEEPNSNNRWDSPCFTVLPNDKIDLDEIYNALFEKKPPPPNMSTQNAPLSATNYLYEMDKVTQEITTVILTAKKLGQEGSIAIPKTNLSVEFPPAVTASQLSKLRRQFLNYSKMHSSSSTIEHIPQLFVQFLNTNFK